MNALAGVLAEMYARIEHHSRRLPAHQHGRPATFSLSLSLALLLSVAPALGAPVRATDFGFSEYTYATSNCTGVKDPLNLYYSYNLSTSLNMTQNILNWDTDFGSTQWFADTGFCDGMDRQRSTGILPPKWHTRLDWAGSFASITASPMHHDDPAPCGDVADSFNSARNHAKSVYQAAGYFVPYTYTANTSASKQCDGRWTAGDGYYARVRP